MTLARLAAILVLTVVSFPVFAGDDDKKEAPAAAQTPEECHAAFRKALLAKDGKAFWALLSQKTRKWLAVSAEELRTKDAEGVAKSIGVTVAELEKLDGKEIGIRQVFAQIDDAAKKRIEAEKLETVRIEGNMATGSRKSGDDERFIVFIKEGDGWYVGMGAGACDGGLDEDKKDGAGEPKK